MADSEAVLLGVFEKTPIGSDGALMPDALNIKKLRAGDLSLARRAFTPREVFNNCVVLPRQTHEGAFIGVVVAEVAALRELKKQFPKDLNIRCTLRALCVLDQVDPTDFDGHAALKFCDEHKSLGPGQKKVVHTHFAAEIARRFSSIQSLDEVYV